MNAKRELKHLPWFWVALFGPIGIGSLLALFIFSANNLGFDLTKDGLALFLDYFKIPLSIAGLSVPTTALVIANHRSQQTIASLNSSEMQNVFSNQLKHREEFIKMLKESEQELNIVFTDKHLLYKTLFPNVSATHFDMKPYQGWLAYVRKEYHGLNLRASAATYERAVEGVYKDIFKLSALLHFKVNDGFVIDSRGRFFDIEPERDWRLSYTKFKPLKHLEIIHDVLLPICFFCHYEDDTQLHWPASPLKEFSEHAENIFRHYKPIGEVHEWG